jgi:CheY-like chemotaxis protein
MTIKHKQPPRLHRQCGRLCCSLLPRRTFRFRPRAPFAAGPAERYGGRDVSATGLGELQRRGTNQTWCAAAFGCAGDSIRNESHEDFGSLTGEMTPHAKIPASAIRFAPDTSAHAAPECQVSSLERIARRTSSVFDPRTNDGQLIYAVDDAPELTELYTILLEGTGYIVRAFNDRATALTALKAERAKPDLLITDCVGPSMSLDRFLECCLVVYPSLRILMVSGYSQTDVRFPQAESDPFIQKPFTIEEFLRRVRATLATR